MAISKKRALRFVVLMGIVSLFGDFTYEAARSVNGQFLGFLGASASVVGFTAGFGELLGYGLRFLFGWIADQTRQYWLAAIIGYVMNLFAIPALALAGNWQIAAVLIVTERAGRAIRKPSVDSMISSAGSTIGHGWAFGLHEALDQIGATLGPLAMSLVLLLKGNYRTGYAMLAVSAVAAMITIAIARTAYPNPNPVPVHAPVKSGFTASYWWGVLAGGYIALGFADFALIGYHFQHMHVISNSTIPLFYASAMAVGAVGAVGFGKLFDRHPAATLIAAFLLASLFAPCVFLGGAKLAFIGAILWGLGMSAQESLLRSLISRAIRTVKKATAFGLFDTFFGLFWFAGSWFMGYLYGHSVKYVVVFSVAAQLIALPLFWLSAARLPSGRRA